MNIGREKGPRKECSNSTTFKIQRQEGGDGGVGLGSNQEDVGSGSLSSKENIARGEVIIGQILFKSKQSKMRTWN